MFEVIWEDAELDRLADAVAAAPLEARNVLIRVVEGLNGQLARSPIDVGESRESIRYRVSVQGRVSIAFIVDVTFRKVHVVRFRYR